MLMLIPSYLARYIGGWNRTSWYMTDCIMLSAEKTFFSGYLIGWIRMRGRRKAAAMCPALTTFLCT